VSFQSPGPSAASIGPLQLRWYGLLLACAATLGLGLARREAIRRGEDLEAFLTTACLALGGGILGARLYHVAFHLDDFARAPWRVLALWEGGVGIFGGLAGGIALTLAYAWGTGRSLGRFLDIIAPSLVLGQAIGRWGNFFNEEAFGRPTTAPWGLYVSPARRPVELLHAERFHPTFLYESMWDFGVFLVTFFVLRRRLEGAPGALFLAYLGLYALGRLPIEGLRLDSEMVGPFRSAQLVAAGCLFLAGAGVPWLWRRRKGGTVAG
jgi:phosphatidylglycerol:prolipoprotein diacylglycerol transferase